MSTNIVIAEWQEQVLYDIRAFCDDGTIMDKTHLPSGGMNLSWFMRGNRYEAIFYRSSDGNVEVQIENATLPYRVLLAGARFGDLATTARVTSNRMLETTVFVDTQAVPVHEKQPMGAVELLRQTLTKNQETDGTQILFVTADAGAGKTRVLEQLVAQQARLYLRGEVDRLYLYVNAQGRALANIDEAFALAIDDVRSAVPYTAVSTLVRVGLIVPLVDGFDELVGQGGYEEGFNTLRRFIDDLGGRGQLIAACRDTYFKQEFLEKTEPGQNWSVSEIKVLAWDAPQRVEYIRAVGSANGKNAEEIQVAIEELERFFASEAGGYFKGKPFFVAKVIVLYFDGKLPQMADDAAEELIKLILEREANSKLLRRSGEKYASSSMLQKIMTDIAEEMWVAETRELDMRVARASAELRGEEAGIRGLDREIIQKRGSMLACLTAGKPGKVEFEHEIYYAYFLAGSLASEFRSNGHRLARSLSRTGMPSSTAMFVSRDLRRTGDIEKAIGVLSAAWNPEDYRGEVVRENAGAIGAAILGELRTVHRSTIRGMLFAGQSFNDVRFEDCMLEDVDFRRSDLTKTQFVSCNSVRVMLVEPVIDAQNTRLDIRGLDVDQSIRGIVLMVAGIEEVVFDPQRVRSTLISCGLPGVSEDNKSKRNVDARAVKLVEKLATALREAVLFWPSDTKNQIIVLERRWTTVRKLLIDHGLLIEEKREIKDRNRTPLRRNFVPSALLLGMNPLAAGVPQAVRDFWDEMERVLPAEADAA